MVAGIIFAVFVALTAQAQVASAQDVPNIAAASDLKFALEETAAMFRERSGRDVKLTFGSSGNFFQQIAQGAPFQMFLSADEDFVFKLAGQNRTPDRECYTRLGALCCLRPTARR